MRLSPLGPVLAIEPKLVERWGWEIRRLRSRWGRRAWGRGRIDRGRRPQGGQVPWTNLGHQRDHGQDRRGRCPRDEGRRHWRRRRGRGCREGSWRRRRRGGGRRRRRGRSRHPWRHHGLVAMAVALARLPGRTYLPGKTATLVKPSTSPGTGGKAIHLQESGGSHGSGQVFLRPLLESTSPAQRRSAAERRRPKMPRPHIFEKKAERPQEKNDSTTESGSPERAGVPLAPHPGVSPPRSPKGGHPGVVFPRNETILSQQS